jgi:hypothetical protein
MSSRGTMTSSFGQMYCCFSRVPQSLCSRLNEIPEPVGAVAGNSFTGMVTRPKETVALAMARAGMRAL